MRRERNLSRTAVVQAAAELADTIGVEQLTLARLAERLGIKTPSLYNHVASLDDLRHELAVYSARLLAHQIGRSAIGRSGDDAVGAVAQAYRAFVKQHPGLYGTVIRAPVPGDTELAAVSTEIIDIVQAVLSAYDLHGEDMIHAVRGLRSIVHGFVSLEAANGFGMPVDVDVSFQRLIQTFTDGLTRNAG